MTRRKQENQKRQALRDSGTLNPHAETVSDELFAEHEFFDPDDLVQLKYEMLRRVRVDEVSVSSAARAFGLSRPTYYKAQADYDGGGLCGLLPAKRGPRRAHKLSESVMEFVSSELAADSSLRAPELARRIKQRFDLDVHPRSVERALERGQKKPGRPQRRGSFTAGERRHQPLDRAVRGPAQLGSRRGLRDRDMAPPSRVGGAAAPRHEGVADHLPEPAREGCTRPPSDRGRVTTAAILGAGPDGGDAGQHCCQPLRRKGGPI